MDNAQYEVYLRQLQENLEQVKELEMIPIARAMMGLDYKFACRIENDWLIRSEAKVMYEALRKTDEADVSTDLIQFFSDPYIQKVWPTAQDFRTRDIATKLKEQWQSRSEKAYLQQYANAQSIREKLTSLDRIKALYADRSEEVYIPDYNNPSPDMRFFFDVDGTPCVAQGDITAIKGKAKGGKTTFLKMLTATAVSPSGEVCGIKRHPVNPDEQTLPLRVLYFDTEQSKCSTDKMLRGVVSMAGLQKDNTPYLKIVNTRRMKTKNRMARFEEELTMGEYDIVILDGVKDIVKNINDPEETDIVVAKLLTIVQDKNIALIVVLHENPSKDTDKMRGWLGTEVTNKAFMVWQVSHEKKSEKYVISCTECREMMPEDIAYKWNEDGEVERCEVEDVTATATEQKQKSKVKRVHESFVRCFMADQFARPYKELSEQFIRVIGRSSRTFDSYLTIAMANGWLDKDSENRYSPSIELRRAINMARYGEEEQAPILTARNIEQMVTDEDLKQRNEELPF